MTIHSNTQVSLVLTPKNFRFIVIPQHSTSIDRPRVIRIKNSFTVKRAMKKLFEYLESIYATDILPDLDNPGIYHLTCGGSILVAIPAVENYDVIFDM